MSRSALKRAIRPRRAARLTPDARRDLLIDAAISVFAAKGLAGAKHTDVARAAHVAVPTTFHYFPTKTELLNAVLDEVSRFLLEDIVAPLVERELPAPALIEEILMTFGDAIDTHPSHVRVWLEWSVSVREGVLDSYQIFYCKALNSMTALVKRGQREGSVEATLAAKDAGRIIVGVAHMIVQMKLSGSSRAQVIHTVHSLVHRYLEKPLR